MIPWGEIGAGVGALFAGAVSTHHVKEWRRRRNGSALNDGTARVLAALKRIDDSIKENGRVTNTLITEHGKASDRAIVMFQQAIAVMKQDCAVSHAKLLVAQGFKPPRG